MRYAEYQHTAPAKVGATALFGIFFQIGLQCFAPNIEAFTGQVEQIAHDSSFQHTFGGEEIFADIRARGYLLDTLVLNAANLGIGQVSLDVDIKEFMGVYEMNIGWNFLMCREAARQMREKGKGAIVFVGSNSALRVTENRCAYCSSKSAMLAVSKSLAVDWGRYGIRSNVVLPGMIKTERWENNVNNAKYCLPNYTPIEDIAEFADIANAVWYFGSDESRNTTGAELVVDGGMLAQLTPNINRELWK